MRLLFMHLATSAAVGLTSLLLLTGCPVMAANYHSARTLPRGEQNWGMNFSASAVQSTDRDAGRPWASQASVVIPEVTLHHGLSDDWEVGGRFGLLRLGGEGDIKYRFASPGNWHLALGAAVSLQVGSLNGANLQIPLLMTWEYSRETRFTLSLSASGSAVSPEDSNLAGLQGVLAAAGGSFGVEFVDDSVSIRPGIEAMYYVTGASRPSGMERPFAVVGVVVHVSQTGSPPSVIETFRTIKGFFKKPRNDDSDD